MYTCINLMGIFEEEERLVLDTMSNKFKKEIELYSKLLKVFASFLQVTSGNIKDNNFPNWTIMLLLSQTLPLMNNALYLLSRGYIRSSEIMIRVVAEAVILSAYFKEFPEAEIDYRAMSYQDFFHKHRIEKMLKKVEREGKIFISNKEKAKQINWNKIVFLNLYKESSRFIHNNSDLIYDITKNNFNTQVQDQELIMGPQAYSDDIFKMGLRRIFNSLLFSLVVLGVSLNIIPDEKEKEIMNNSQDVIEKLNI